MHAPKHIDFQFSRHQDMLLRLAEALPPSPERLAMILVGSVARGEAREDSDVDVLLLHSNGSYASRHVQPKSQLVELVTSPSGGMSIEDIDMNFLHEALSFGNEPTRWMFTDAKILYSEVPGLTEHIQAIATYPLELQATRMHSFASQLPMHFSYLELAEWSKNPYLLAEASCKIIHFAGRLILAANAMLYPNRKWFWSAIHQVSHKPEHFCSLANELLQAPSIASAELLLEHLYAYRQDFAPPSDWREQFAADSVRHWQRGNVPLEDC